MKSANRTLFVKKKTKQCPRVRSRLRELRGTFPAGINTARVALPDQRGALWCGVGKASRQRFSTAPCSRRQFKCEQLLSCNVHLAQKLVVYR